MRDVTRREIDDYFRFIDTKEGMAASEFTQAQAILIGHTALEYKVPFNAIKKGLWMMSSGMNPEDFVLSLWVSAFQMGREFESRLISIAIRDGRLDPGEPISKKAQ